MIPIYAPQGSIEWHLARAGLITGSIAYKALNAPHADSTKDLAWRLAIERISGEPLNEGNVGWAAKRGHELEPEARMEHQAEINEIVEPVGFAIIADDWWFGCSADGLVERKGGAEYKCFTDPKALRSIVHEGDFGWVEVQSMFGLWVTGREWWDMGLYCPALKPVGLQFTRHRLRRNDDAIDSMVERLQGFKAMVEDYEGFLRLQGERLGHKPLPIEQQRAHLLKLGRTD